MLAGVWQGRIHDPRSLLNIFPIRPLLFVKDQLNIPWDWCLGYYLGLASDQAFNEGHFQEC